MKKKSMGIFILAVLLIVLAPAQVFAETISEIPAAPKTIVFTVGQPYYYVDGNAYAMKAAPLIIDGHLMVPVLDAANPMGASVNWDAVQGRYTFELNGKSVEITLGSDKAKVNGSESSIGFNPFLPSHLLLFVPLSYVATNLGGQVSWDESSQQVTLICP